MPDTMMSHWSDYAKLFAGLIAVVNPIGMVPIFLSLTEARTPGERQHTGRTATIALTIILLVSLVSGEMLLRAFGITIPSFRVAGGILILLMSLSMLGAETSRARRTPEEHSEAYQKESVAVVPLAIPLLGGPGAISTVILYAQKGTDALHYGLIVGAILTVSLVAYLSFRAAPYIAQIMGRTGMNIVTRIMGLFMAAMAVEFITSGLLVLFPGLQG